MTRCANAAGSGQRSFGAGSCAQRVMPEPMAASHLLMKLLANPLSQQAGKWLVILQSAVFAITSDLASVVCAPSRMASCFTSNVSEVRS